MQCCSRCRGGNENGNKRIYVLNKQFLPLIGDSFYENHQFVPRLGLGTSLDDEMGIVRNMEPPDKGYTSEGDSSFRIKGLDLAFDDSEDSLLEVSSTEEFVRIRSGGNLSSQFL